MKRMWKKCLTWILVVAMTVTGFMVNAPLARAQDREQTDVEAVYERLFDGIKKDNESEDAITGNFLETNDDDGIYYAGKGYLGWNFNYSEYSSRVKVVMQSSSHPEIVNPLTMKVKLPEEDTQVTLSGTISPINDGTGETQSFDLAVTVKSRSSVTMPIDRVAENLFEAIRGENESPDNITTYLGRLKKKNETVAWVNPYSQEVTFEEDRNGIDVKFIESDNEDVLSSETLKITFPETTTTVTLKARLEHRAQGYDEEMIVELPLIIQGKDIHDPGLENTFTYAAKQNIFDAIKGENASPNNVTSDLVLPKGTLPIYAKGTPDDVQWDGASYYYRGEVNFTECDKPEVLDVETLEITRPTTDTVVTLKGTITPRYYTDGDSETFELPLNIIAEEKPRDYLKEISVEKLFDAIKGENTQQDEIRKDMSYPTGSEPFYAVVDEDDELTWQDTAEGAHLKVSLSDNSDEATISSEDLSITRDSEDKNVDLTFTVRDITREEGGEDPVEKDFVLSLKVLKEAAMLPDELRDGLAEEILLLEAVKANLADGYLLNGYNLDKDNIVRSMDVQFKEVYFDEDGNLYWEPSARGLKRKGFKLSNSEYEDKSFSFQYPDGGGGLLHPWNLVLQSRPEVDTRVRIGHMVESYKFQKYMDQYPEDEELQKIRKQMLWTEVTVKAINAKAESFDVADNHIEVVAGERNYSVLLPDTRESVQVTVNPENRGAAIVLDGTALEHEFSKDVALENGYKTFGVRITDEDYLEENTRQIESYKITVASQAYLEGEIAELPEASQATEQDEQKAEELLEQLLNLSEADQANVAGADKLLAYKPDDWDGLAKYKKQLDIVEDGLFDAIKAENGDADHVYKDMVGRYYAKVDGDAAEYSEEPVDSDVRIEWLESSHPYYINVFPGTTFESGYKRAFQIAKRPAEGQNGAKVTFRARLYSLVEPTVYKDVELPFKLLAYNADLAEVTMNRGNDLTLLPGQYEYDVTYERGEGDLPTELEMTFKAVNPGVAFKLGELESELGPYADGQTIAVPLDEDGEAVINLTITDDFKNSYDNNWAEKTYTFRLKPGYLDPVEALDRIKELRNKALDEYKANLDGEAAVLSDEAVKPYEDKYQEIKEEIENAETIEEVEEAYAKRNELRALLDDALLEYDKSKAKEKLDGIDENRYEESEQARLNEIIENAKTAIDEAESRDAVSALIADARQEIAKLEEKAEQAVTVYFTITKHAEQKNNFITMGDEEIVKVPLEVNYFDLEDYNLGDYYRYEAESFEDGGAYKNDVLIKQPTLLHAMIKFAEQYYLDGEKLTLPSDAMTIGPSSGPTSLFFLKLFGMSYNLTYYVNGNFPLMGPGMGASADYILLHDGDEIELVNFDVDEDYEKITFASFDKSDVTVDADSEFSLQLRGKYTEYKGMDSTTYLKAMPGEHLRARKADGGEWFNLPGETDGKGRIKLSFEEAGRYIVTVDETVTNEDRSVMALPACEVVVNDVDEEEDNLVLSYKAETDYSIILEWEPREDVDGYEVWRKEGDSEFDKYGSTSKSSYKNARKLARGQEYAFKVCAYKETDGVRYYTDWSNTITHTMKKDSVDLGVQKTTLTATLGGTYYSNKLSWKKSGYRVDGYQVWRKAGKDGKYYRLGSTSKTSYNNSTKLYKGTRYYYKVRGYRKVGNKYYYTKWSYPKSRVAKKHSADYGVKYTKINLDMTAKKGVMKLRWKKSPGYSVQGYQVWRKVGKNGKYVRYGSTKKTYYNNSKGIKKGRKYYYKVRGYRKVSGKYIYTKWSNVRMRTAK